MNIYLNKTKIVALLMMIDEAEGMMSGSADGWYGLHSKPELYGEIQDAIEEIKNKLSDNGYTFEKNVVPLIGQ